VRIVVHEWDSSAPKQGKAENIMIPILLFNVAIIEIRTMNVFPTSLKPLLWKWYRRFYYNLRLQMQEYYQHKAVIMDSYWNHHMEKSYGEADEV